MQHLLYKTTADMFSRFTEMIFTGGADPQFTRADRLYLYNLLFEITDPVNDLNFGEVLWSKTRWQKFGRSYLQEQSLSEWIEKCTEKRPGVSDSAEVGYQFSVRGHGAGHKLFGNCLWGMSFHRKPSPRITILSRVTNFIPVGYLEMSLGNLMSEQLSEILGQSVPIFWYVTQLNYSMQKSFPFWYRRKLHLHYKDRLTVHAKTWTKHRIRRYNALITGKVEEYAFATENRLYRNTAKKQRPYYPRLEDLDGIALL